MFDFTDAGGFYFVMKAVISTARGEEVDPLGLGDPFTPFFKFPGQDADDCSPPVWKLYGPIE